MHFISTLLAFAATTSVITLVSAVPATPSSCNPSATFTANFDTLHTGRPVPASYGPLGPPNTVFNNMAVANASSYHVQPTSGNNSALLPLLGASISGSFTLESFSFACSQVTVYDFPSLPVSCSIQLIGIPYPRTELDIVVQTFKYSPSEPAMQGQVLGKMRRVVVREEFGQMGRVYWNVVAGGGTTQILVDDLVLVAYGNCP